MRPLFTTLLTLIIVISIFMTPSCNDAPEEKTPGSIRDSISAYRQQVTEINREINRLERQLADMGERVPAREATRVRTSEIRLTDFDHYFRINGSVEAVRDAMISPEINGRMNSIRIQRGDRVNSGQVVAELNTSVVESNIEEVRTNLQLAEIVYERQKRLWDQEIGSEMQYLEARNRYMSLQSNLATLESQLDLARLRAPFPGIVDNIFIKEGEMAMPGSPVMQIINLERLYINTDVSERYLPMINPEDSVILRFPVYPDFEDYVPVYRIGNVINPENRSFRLQLLIDNPSGRFKPNMVATLGIRTFSVSDAVVIPSVLIKQDVQGHYVNIALRDESENYHVERVYIERGQESEGRTVIESGLQAGDLLITEGHNRVGQGDPITILND